MIQVISLKHIEKILSFFSFLDKSPTASPHAPTPTPTHASASAPAPAPEEAAAFPQQLAQPSGIKWEDDNDFIHEVKKIKKMLQRKIKVANAKKIGVKEKN